MKCKVSIAAARVVVLFAVHLIACRTPAAEQADAGCEGAGNILVPDKGWPWGMPVFEATVKLDQVQDLGKTPHNDGSKSCTNVRGGRSADGEAGRMAEDNCGEAPGASPPGSADKKAPTSVENGGPGCGIFFDLRP
jgi:hypothetical protein